MMNKHDGMDAVLNNCSASFHFHEEDHVSENCVKDMAKNRILCEKPNIEVYSYLRPPQPIFQKHNSYLRPPQPIFQEHNRPLRHTCQQYLILPHDLR